MCVYSLVPISSFGHYMLTMEIDKLWLCHLYFPEVDPWSVQYQIYDKELCWSSQFSKSSFGFLATSPIALNSAVILETVEGSTHKLPATFHTDRFIACLEICFSRSAKQISTSDHRCRQCFVMLSLNEQWSLSQ